MNRSDLLRISEESIRAILAKRLPANTHVYLFGSRARGDGRWNSDSDLWVDASLTNETIIEIEADLEDSVVPFAVDIVTTAQLKGEFGQRVTQEARQWM